MITGEEFISLAGKLASRPDADEATNRAAVSRAYYGAFHLAKALLDDMGFSAPRNPSGHAFVYRRLFFSRQQNAQAIGALLSDLHPSRIEADYDLSSEEAGTNRNAKECVEESHRVRSAILACRQEPAFSQIKSDIATYEKKIGG
ncbi:MAG TPA: HEPN domain-containing protein [Pirellulales bacterium]|nr:HEPN domain-containing protein [Pirellulales bacterium]